MSFSSGITAEAVRPPCNEDLFDINVDNLILGHLDFSLTLFLCSNYNKLMTCVEDWAKKTRCWGYGFLVDEIYLEVHQTYFSLCGYVRDPPLFTLIMLIAPCIIVTLFLPLLCVHIAPRDT
uniref:Receptor activity modifying protein 1 n=1 Tax=Maylandia zebra TaxID=106582 RepID=A0A3P9CBY0_9CICH